MSVLRVNKNKNYTVMSNYHLQDKNLSLKAKGLLSIMLSLPDDWDYSIKGLVSICKEGETAVTSTLDELKECGYLIVTKVMPNKENGGKYEYIYDIYEQPHENQKVENQGVGFLGVENHPLNKDTTISNSLDNTNNITNKQNTEKENPPLSPKGKDDWQEKMIDERSITGKLKETIMEFLEYKKEKKQSYKPRGFKSFLTELQGKVSEYGDQAVIDCINHTMSSNYDGVSYWSLNKNQKKNNGNKEDIMEMARKAGLI